MARALQPPPAARTTLCLMPLLAGLAGLGATPAAVAQTAPSTLPGPQLKLALGRSASMVYEPRRLPAAQPLADPQAGAAAPSLGLEFRSPPAQRDGLRSVLRVQLSSDAALQFRPRRGGLAVSYRAEF